jgi:hypothetical protein
LWNLFWDTFHFRWFRCVELTALFELSIFEKNLSS